MTILVRGDPPHRRATTVRLSPLLPSRCETELALRMQRRCAVQCRGMGVSRRCLWAKAVNPKKAVQPQRTQRTQSKARLSSGRLSHPAVEKLFSFNSLSLRSLRSLRLMNCRFWGRKESHDAIDRPLHDFFTRFWRPVVTLNRPDLPDRFFSRTEAALKPER